MLIDIETNDVFACSLVSTSPRTRRPDAMNCVSLWIVGCSVGLLRPRMVLLCPANGLLWITPGCHPLPPLPCAIFPSALLFPPLTTSACFMITFQSSILYFYGLFHASSFVACILSFISRPSLYLSPVFGLGLEVAAMC